MNRIEEQSLSCPYCGEHVSVLVECSTENQEYIEDCQVCCRPMLIQVTVHDGTIGIVAKHEND